MIKKLVIASHNAGKVREIDELLARLAIDVVSAADLHLLEPEETGDTFHANAAIKSIAAAKASGLPALADDSGLVIPALGGAPGIYSARWAGEQKDFTMAMKRIETELLEAEGRAQGAIAHFICVLSLALPDGTEHAFEGRIDGYLTFPLRGEKGFGYDPIFIPKGYDVTFAEMAANKKHEMSHRADAFRKFVTWLERR
jgi:XTP/dITP diphosphohydrolase